MPASQKDTEESGAITRLSISSILTDDFTSSLQKQIYKSTVEELCLQYSALSDSE